MDWTAIVVFALVVAAATTVQIVATTRQTDRVSDRLGDIHLALDGRLTELLKTTASASRMEGIEQERRETRGRDDAERQREHEREQAIP